MSNSGSPERLRLSNSLRASVRDGVCFSIALGVAESYLSPFGIFLQGDAPQIGLLVGLPLFVGALMQLVGVQLMERLGTRRRIILVGATIQALMWLPIGLLPFLQPPGVGTVNTLIVLVTITFAACHITIPAWTSMMGDSVPEHLRGRFFGYRGRLSGISLLISLILAGLLLRSAESSPYERWAFLGLFVVACGARLASTYWLKQQIDPQWENSQTARFSFLQFLKRAPHSNFARFTFFVACTSFAVNFSGPFFAVYMLRELHFSYLQFMTVSAASLAMNFIMMAHWGRITDRFGNKKVLNLCSILTVVIPLMWLCTTNYLLLLLTNLFSGCVWAGFNLAAWNYLFDAVTPPKRARCVAYQATINASFLLVGAYLGGLAVRLAETRPTILTETILPDSPYLTVFLISALMRLAVLIFFLPRFRETRNVEEIPYSKLVFIATNLRPITGITFEVINLLRRTTAVLVRRKTDLQNWTEKPSLLRKSA